MRLKLVSLITLVAGLLVIVFTGLLLLDEHLLPKENGLTHLTSESIRIYGQPDEIVDGLAFWALLGALVASLGVGLLAIFARGRASTYGGMVVIIAAVFIFIQIISLQTFPLVVIDGLLLAIGFVSVWLAATALLSVRQVSH